jgi:hypothetical protein
VASASAALVRQHDDLARIRWVGENFLVTGQGCIENDFPVAFRFGAVSGTAKDAPVLERKYCLHGLSGEWIF